MTTEQLIDFGVKLLTRYDAGKDKDVQYVYITDQTVKREYKWRLHLTTKELA